MNLTRKLKDTAVYWPPGSVNVTGEVTYGTPVEKVARWENKQEKFTDKHQDIQISNAVVYMADETELDGYLFLGELSDLPVDRSDPRSIGAGNRAWEIRAVGRVENLRGNNQLYKVHL